MTKSQTAGWASDSPTPAQLKEFFAQVDSGRITKDRLQSFLRGAGQVDGDWFSFTTSGLSLIELREQNPELFYEDPGWKNQPFAGKRGRKQKIQLRTSAQPDSFSKNWDEQQKLLGESEFVPTAADLVEGMISCYKATGKRLFAGCWVRTSDVSSDGSRVYVRFLSGGRICVSFFWGDDRDLDLGLAVSRKSARSLSS